MLRGIIMLRRSVPHRDGDGADDVARVLRTHVVHVAELLTAEVTLVEPLERHIQDQIGIVVWSTVRAVQELLHECPAHELEGIVAGDEKRHLGRVVVDVPVSGH